jgi:hypothetical protein
MSDRSGYVNPAMDAAAKEADLELDKIYDEGIAGDVAVWIKRWYLKAGYKRLCRLLIRRV